jgi:hypothetical protein
MQARPAAGLHGELDAYCFNVFCGVCLKVLPWIEFLTNFYATVGVTSLISVYSVQLRHCSKRL